MYLAINFCRWPVWQCPYVETPVHTVSLARQVGFCSNATTVIECEDSIRLEREDEDAPVATSARRLRSQQSGQAMRRVACCDSTDCNAKVVCSSDVCGLIDNLARTTGNTQLIPFALTNATSGLVTEEHPQIIRRPIKPAVARSSSPKKGQACVGDA